MRCLESTEKDNAGQASQPAERFPTRVHEISI
jgi:hypothetical protein